MLSLGYRFTERLSSALLLGSHDFPGEGATDDVHWFHASLNGKHRYPIGHFSLFANGGLGVYRPERGDTALGLNVGGGMGYSLSPQWSVELGYNFHNVTAGDKDEFSTMNIGVRCRFGTQ